MDRCFICAGKIRLPISVILLSIFLLSSADSEGNNEQQQASTSADKSGFKKQSLAGFSETENFDDFKKLPLPSEDYRDVIVHLRDWKYKEIEEECANLKDIGYAAVQVRNVTNF